MDIVKLAKKDLRTTVIVVMAITVIIIGSMLFLKQDIRYHKIRDKCGLIAGKVMHTISNEDICRVKCRARCESENEVFYKSEFEKSTNGCHICHCYCKR